MVKVQIFISGFVQGVGFRQFVKRSAEQAGIKGWVRNLKDGRVEAVLQGEKEDIEKIIKLCEKGPFLSEVKDVDVFWQNNSVTEREFETFDIVSNGVF